MHMTHPFAFQEEVNRFEYFDDLAMRAAIKIVDADDEQVPHILGGLRFKHVKKYLQSSQYANVESSGQALNHVHAIALPCPFSLGTMPIMQR